MKKISFKRLLISALSLFLISMMVSCNSSAENHNDNTDGHSGKKLIITLATNPTTGYDWVYEMGDKSSNAGEIAFVSAKEDLSSNKEGLVGAPITREYEFKATKSGKQSLVFTYKRNWEGGDKAYDLIYELNIHKDLSIEVLNETLIGGSISNNQMSHHYKLVD